MVQIVQDECTAVIAAIAEREAAVAEREAETSAGCEALAADRAALDSEVAMIGAMEAAVRCQDTRVRLNLGGALFETWRTTLTAVPGSMLEAMFSGRHTIIPDEDGRFFIDRDGEHFRLVLNFLRNCGSDAAAADVIRALPYAQLREVRGELVYYGLDDAVFGGWFSFERASFVPGPEMEIGRASCSVVALPGDQEALVIGGEVYLRKRLDAIRSTELLNLSTMVFTTGPEMLTSRAGCAALLLPGGSRVLVVGGSNDYAGEVFFTTELLSLSTMTFEPGPHMLSSRSGCAAVVLDARRVLVVGGGEGPGSTLATTEVLDTETMTFMLGPSMQQRRWGCAAVLLPGERRVLVVGGRGYSGRLATTEILDIDTMTFAPGPVMSTGRFSHCAVVSLSGSILVFGESASGQNTTEVLSLETMLFAAGPTMRTSRKGCAAFVLPQDHSPRRALVVGGYQGNSYLACTEVLTVAGCN